MEDEKGGAAMSNDAYSAWSHPSNSPHSQPPPRLLTLFADENVTKLASISTA
jgi:hypothetical protein